MPQKQKAVTANTPALLAFPKMFILDVAALKWRLQPRAVKL
jgi:hypothetical protein